MAKRSKIAPRVRARCRVLRKITELKNNPPQLPTRPPHHPAQYAGSNITHACMQPNSLSQHTTQEKVGSKEGNSRKSTSSNNNPRREKFQNPNLNNPTYLPSRSTWAPQPTAHSHLKIQAYTLAYLLLLLFIFLSCSLSFLCFFAFLIT